jgi:hypothetical protein
MGFSVLLGSAFMLVSERLFCLIFHLEERKVTGFGSQ